MPHRNIEPVERLGFDRRMTREEINELPLKSYAGAIEVIRDGKGLEKAVKRLAKETILGFDTETRPNFKKGQNNLPSLLQLAGHDRVYIFQLKLTGLPAGLRKLLANGDIVKTGVAIDHDILQLQRISRFQEDGFIGLSRFAKSAGIKNHGLRGLAAVLLGFRISKGAQRSNWGADTLTDKQIRYAATDAWAGREIFLLLEEMGAIQPEIDPDF